MTDVPRPEHPRPDLRRTDDWWINLNGTWQFEIDRACSGDARGLVHGRDLKGQITVPFCPESRLSGVQDRDFLNCVWYRRLLSLPKAWAGRRVLLHVGACDNEATVWLNGAVVGFHRGGYTPFTAELTDGLRGDGTDELVIRAQDDVRSPGQPAGKQSARYESWGCLYTRTTGIWQTVWLEAVPTTAVRRVVPWPDHDSGRIVVQMYVDGRGQWSGRVRALADGQEASTATFAGRDSASVFVALSLTEPRPWSPADPLLYTIEVELEGAGQRDCVTTWAGLRKFHCRGARWFLNNEPVFLRTVLDQGFYPDGIYTAPSVADLENDIDMSMAFGFNGARLHQKVFEPQFLHLCDRKGYLVFGEYGDWCASRSAGNAFDTPQYAQNMLREWRESVERDVGHPALIGWCPQNESWEGERGVWGEWLTRELYRLTKSLDPTRPVLDTSGYFHYETDVYDVHDYGQDVEEFRERYRPLAEGRPSEAWSNRKTQMQYAGQQPFFVSEYGGLKWVLPGERDEGWGYGQAPKDEREFVERFRGLAESMLFNPGIAGFCYTQLTDVEQEVNGLMTYDRRAKFDPTSIAEILTQKAAVEE